MQEESRFKITVQPADVYGAAKETMNSSSAPLYNFLYKMKQLNMPNKKNYILNNYLTLPLSFQEGKQLPDFGACKHYKYSLRWFRFGCCNKIFPCDICHDETSDHNCEYAKTILCGFCSFEQTANNKVCSKCGKIFVAYYQTRN